VVVPLDDDDVGVRTIGTVVVPLDDDDDGVRTIGTVVVPLDDEDVGCGIGVGCFIGTGIRAFGFPLGIQSPALFLLYPFAHRGFLGGVEIEDLLDLLLLVFVFTLDV
jgi:hypothetical protein